MHDYPAALLADQTQGHDPGRVQARCRSPHCLEAMCNGKDRDRRCNPIADSMLDPRVRLRIEVCRALFENEDAADAQLE